MEQFIFEFLGNSQSFIATIATIVAMSILADQKSNFIHQLHQNLHEKMEKDYSSRNNSTKLNFDKLLKSPSYILIKLCINGKTINDEDTLNKSRDIERRINIWKLNVQNQYISTSPTSRFDANASEFHIAPLYSLGYIVVVFIVDEICRIGSYDTLDFIVSFMIFFTLFAFVYWISRWSKYIYTLATRNGNTNMFFKCVKIIYFSLITKIDGEPDSSGYENLLKNFFKLIVLSALASSLICALDCQTDFYLRDVLLWLKLSTLVFSFLNGIFFPIFLPWMSCKILTKIEFEKRKRAQKNVEKKIDKFLKEIDTKTNGKITYEDNA